MRSVDRLRQKRKAVPDQQLANETCNYRPAAVALALCYYPVTLNCPPCIGVRCPEFGRDVLLARKSRAAVFRVLSAFLVATSAPP